MSILKSMPEKVPSKVWVDNISQDWTDAGLAVTIITNQQLDLFNEKIGKDSEVDWQWFQMILMTDVPWQLDWLEKCILRGVTIDKTWRALDTGHQVTIFDLVSTVEGGIRQETRDILIKIRKIYEILFMRQDVQPALDYLNDLEEGKHWLQLNTILSSYVLGPLNEPKPLLHYVVLMERYDLVRGLLTSATAVQQEYSDTDFLKGWINMADDCGRTILHITAMQRRESWAKWFIANSANPALRDSDHKTAFHYAPEIKYLQLFWDKMEDKPTELLTEILEQGVADVESLRWLLDNGANPNSEKAFLTASKTPGFISILVEYGGDPTVFRPANNAPVLAEWLTVGGSGGTNYEEMVVKHLTGRKSAKWICFLISLQNGFLEQAGGWWQACDIEQRNQYAQLIENIEPESAYMKQYQQWLEKVTNMQDV
tara:strand:+ start:48844 stop:50124 length:1281 start_codon:yes stop_codon:yes gene_type:complete